MTPQRAGRVARRYGLLLADARRAGSIDAFEQFERWHDGAARLRRRVTRAGNTPPASLYRA